MNFNELDDAGKLERHLALSEYANRVGGANYFLQMLETMRATKPHALSAKNCEFRFQLGTIKWNKAIFEDKLALLLKARLGESKRGNLLPAADDKEYKNVLNLIRALKPIEFVVKPKNMKDGEGFTIHPFDVIDESTTRINPIFDIVFFSSLDTAKKILSHKPSGSQEGQAV